MPKKKSDESRPSVNNPSTRVVRTPGKEKGGNGSGKKVRPSVTDPHPTKKGVWGVKGGVAAPGTKNPSRRCHATVKRTGLQCKRAAIKGGSVCTTHGGAAPHVQRSARQRLLDLVDPAIAQLAKILNKPDVDDNVRLRAIQALLDRTGFKPGVVLEVKEHDPWMDTVYAALSNDSMEDDRSLGGGGGNTPAHIAANAKQFMVDANAAAWRDYDAEDAEDAQRGRIFPDENTVQGTVSRPDPSQRQDGSPIVYPGETDRPMGTTEMDPTPSGRYQRQPNRIELIQARLIEQDEEDRRRGFRR